MLTITTLVIFATIAMVIFAPLITVVFWLVFGSVAYIIGYLMLGVMNGYALVIKGWRNITIKVRK